MTAPGNTTPLSLSDIPCDSCGLYFRLDGDLIDHRQDAHSTNSWTEQK